MLGSLFPGSVAQRVVHLSKVPVLLVKQEAVHRVAQGQAPTL